MSLRFRGLSFFGRMLHTLKQHGQRSKAAIITESGWYRNTDTGLPASPGIEARYVAALFAESVAADIKVLIWWMLYDPGPGYLDYGLVTLNEPVVRMPSFDAFQTIVAELGTAKFDRQLTAEESGAEELVAFLFRDNENARTIHVAWLEPVDTGEVKELYLPASTATVRDIYGADGVVDGNVVVPASGPRPHSDKSHPSSMICGTSYNQHVS